MVTTHTSKFGRWAAAVLLATLGCGGDPGSTLGGPCTGPEQCSLGETCLDHICVLRSTVEPNCVDMDGDGRGLNCSAGLDCNDSDSNQTGTERCDGQDNDCDGRSDEGVLNACGTCDPACSGGSIGGGGMPFTPNDDNSDGVALDDSGAIVLDSRRVNTNFIWIASTGTGEVSKVDTTTFLELARYRTGVDPSRTSVNTLGDVYVGNRAGRSVTKISALGADCTDTNGDGQITTSSGSTSLPFGQDDCVQWRTDIPNSQLIRAVAAQDIVGLEGNVESYVWVGDWGGTVYKLDGRDGRILLTLTAPTPPYGFALDNRGRLWMASLANQVVGFINTTMCTTQEACESAALCRASTAEGAECDNAIKATIPLVGTSSYGVTVDFKQRVWFAGSQIRSYDPTQPSGMRWRTTQGADAAGCNGIGADGEGFIWAACQGTNKVVRFDGDSFQYVSIPTGPNRGIGIDADGKVWGILRHTGPAAVVITPGATLNDHTVSAPVGPSLGSPYTYSDMTGLQLRLATNPRGHYRHVFEGCESGMETRWGNLSFVAETPQNTEVLFRIRTANTREGLDSAEWVLVGMVPPQSSPLDVAGALTAAGVQPGRFAMIEVQLAATRQSSDTVITPRVRSIGLQHQCGVPLG